MLSRATLFIDHQEAHIYAVDAENSGTATVRMHHHVHRHPEHDASGKHRVADEERFFGDVARALKDIEAFLVVGPSTAKTEFVHYLERHDHALRSKIAGVETVDHPTDPQLVALTRARFFPESVARV